MLLLCCFLGSCNFSFAQVLNKKVALTIDNQPLIFILDTLTLQTAAQFTYDKNRIPTQKKFSLQAQNITLEESLNRLFSNTNIQFKVNKNYLILYRDNIPYHTISGYIRDDESDEALIEANIFDTKYFRGNSSNEYGFYSLSLPEGKHVVKSTFVGYQERTDTIELYQNLKRNFTLQSGSALAEIVVLGNSKDSLFATSILANPTVQGEKIAVEKAQSLPTFMGERDVLKYLQLLPGVASGGLAGNNLYIRGGSLDQNLILLDDVPLYNVNHLFGLVSIFNGNIVHSAKTYLDGFPARFGERLSSIVDVRTKDGNKQAMHGGVSLGFATGAIHLEGPIQPNKSSFLVAARRTWLDLPLDLLGADPTLRFYDLNAKAHFKLSPKDQLYVSFYTGKDTYIEQSDTDSLNTDFPSQTTVKWGNTALSMRWNRLLSQKLFLNTTIFHSTFHFDIDYFRRLQPVSPESVQFSYQSGLRQSALKTDFTFSPNSSHLIRFGSHYAFLQNKVGQLQRDYEINGVLQQNLSQSPDIAAHQLSLYVEDQIKLNPNWTLHPGFRLLQYSVNKKSYWLPQFRFQLNHAINTRNTWGTTYTRMAQPVLLLDNTSVESNNIKWVLATEDIPPATAQQVSLYFQTFFAPGWRLKWTGYYKKMQNLRRFRLGANIINTVPDWEKETVDGSGQSYGLEVLLAKTTGKTQGWLAYTLSKSQRQFDNFAQNQTFPYQHDRRHIFNLTLTHQFPQKPQKERKISAVWTYALGNWQTVPQQVILTTNGTPLPIVAAINNYQLPPIHRLDLSYYRQKTTVRGRQHQWTIGVYNVYGRNNPYTAELQFTTPPNTFNIIGNNLSVTPVPYVTYGFQF